MIPTCAPLVELVSPIPPMRTGTANYLGTVLKRVSAIPGCAALMRVVIDSNFLPASEAPHQLHGVSVCDFNHMPQEVPIGSTRILFLANNDHHAYVLAALARQTSRAHGKVIVVIHDPATFMINRFMVGNGEYRLTLDQLEQAASLQYRSATKRLVGSRLAGHMPDIFEFVTHCQQLALTKAHEIWVHSLFGLAKLICESDLPAHQFPKIRVCAHPHSPAEEAPPATPAKLGLRIGVFGWVTPPKRVTAVIRGLSLALDRLGPDDDCRIELLVVGRRPPESAYDPARDAERFDVADRVRFIDYPSDEEFTRLQSSCQLIFNLRFPSCGETSGTLSSAEATSANIVTSRYQSFHEGNEGHRTITILPIFEDWDIAAAICEAYEQRLGAGTTAKPTADRGPAICPIEKLLLHEILERRQAVRDSAERGADLA